MPVLLACVPVDPLAAFVAFEAQSRAQHGLPQTFVDDLFEEQRRVFNDPSKRRSIRTTRRAGKTHFHVVDIANDMCRYPGDWTYYLTPRLPQSRRNIEPPLRALIRKHNLPIERQMTDGQLYYVHRETEHTLWIAGCKDMTEADKYRGDKIRKLKIDEAGAWRTDVLEYLIKESAGPALSDYDGTIDISGTPAPIPAGYWHAIDTGQGSGEHWSLKQWSSHSWSVLDNPHHRYHHRPDLIQFELDENYGGDPSNPAFLREWHGLWVADMNSIIYQADTVGDRDNPGRNLCFREDLPKEGSWFFVLSIDIGWNDQATFTVSCSRHGFREVFYLESYGRSEMLFSNIVQECRRIADRYPISKIVADNGGSGKTVAMSLSEIMIKEYHLPVVPAQKTSKAVRIRAMANALIGGWIKVDPHGCSQLLSEWRALAWNEDRTDHSPICADDCSDGALYGYTEHPAYERWEKEPPEFDTQEYHDERIDELRKSIVADIGLKKQQSMAQTPNQRKQLQRRREQLARKRRMY